MTQPRVAIIGGGIGGAALGAAMTRLGLAFRIFEQSRELRAIGYGLTLQKNALDALDVIGIGSAIRARGAPVHTGVLRRPGGRVLTSATVDLCAIQRPTLLSGLAAELPDGSVLLGRRIEDPADPDLADAEFVIAADGLHSVFRQRIVPGEGPPRDSGYTAWRGLAAASPDIARHLTSGVVSETWGRGTRFGIVPIDGGRVYWFAVASVDPIRDEARARHFLLDTFRGWHEPIGLLIDATPADAILESRIVDRVPISIWHEGRVLLMGDAAHPMTPNLGQGGGQAIEDAVVLAHLLKAQAEGRLARDEVAAHFFEQRHERVSSIVNQSFSFGRIAQHGNPLLVMLRDLAVRLMPRSVQDARLADILTFPGVRD